MQSVLLTTAVTVVFVALLTIVPALMPENSGVAVGALVFSFIVLVLKTGWMVALAYVGARLALRHERRASQ